VNLATERGFDNVRSKDRHHCPPGRCRWRRPARRL